MRAQVERHHKTGEKEIDFPDGTRKYILPSGREMSEFPDGVTVVEYPEVTCLCLCLCFCVVLPSTCTAFAPHDLCLVRGSCLGFLRSVWCVVYNDGDVCAVFLCVPYHSSPHRSVCRTCFFLFSVAVFFVCDSFHLNAFFFIGQEMFIRSTAVRGSYWDVICLPFFLSRYPSLGFLLAPSVLFFWCWVSDFTP